MDFGQFVRECYLRSTPSVDLNEVKGEKVIDPCEHTLLLSVFTELVEEFAQGNQDLRTGCYMWCLNQGPQIIND